MANTTDPGFAPIDDGGSGPDAVAPRTDFADPSTPPFGDPDQRLYGGGWHSSPPPIVPVTAAESPYEGRHRALE